MPIDLSRTHAPDRARTTAPSPNAPSPNAPASTPLPSARLAASSFGAAGANPFAGLSVEAALFEALMAQKRSAEGDLLGIVDELRANNAKKGEVRKLQGLLRELESLAGHAGAPPSAEAQARIDALGAELDRLVAAHGLGPDDALVRLLGARPDGASTSKEDVAKWFGQVRDELDALAQHYSDLGEENNIQLQLALSRKSQFETALSNGMKSMDESAKGIIRNLG
jgi:uncharacterized membrane protein